jgi:hypothetical protein
MKIAIVCVLLILGTVLPPCAVGQKSNQRAEIRISDTTAAISVAEPALVKVYGKRQIDDEKPLKAMLQNGVWHVYGTLCCSDGNGKHTCEEGRCVGGVALVKVRQKDGKILSITHGK